MSDSKVLEHVGHIAEIEIEWTIFGMLVRTVRHGVVSRPALDDITRVCDEDRVLFLIFPSYGPKVV